MTSTDSLTIELRAALAFDRPTLRASDSEGAKAFLEILDLRWPRDEDPDETPLGIAATGLKEMFSGNMERGRQHLERLLAVKLDSQSTQLAHLLGRALLAWTSDSGDIEIRTAAAESERLRDDHLATLYLLKLAGFALDKGHRDQARELLRASRERVPEQRKRLAWRLSHTTASLEGRVLLETPPLDPDPLADFPWIEERASIATHDALKKAAEATVADPWRRTIHLGSTPIDFVTAAVLQAEWAGALWYLSQLRLQQGAMILVAGGRNTEEWEGAVANWVLGGGSNIQDVTRFAERHFDSASTRRLITEHLVDGRRLGRADRYVDVLLAIWDLLDEDLAAQILRQFEPSLSADTPQDKTCALWAALGALVPGVWSNLLAEKTPAQQMALLPHLTVGLVQLIPTSALQTLTERCIRALAETLNNDSGVPPAELLRSATVLLRAPALDRSTQASLERQLKQTPLEYQLDVISEVGDLRSEFDVPALIARALELTEREASAARQGRYAFYPRPPTETITRLAIAFPELPESSDIANLLLDLSLDSSLVIDFRIDALQAIYRLALSHSFDDHFNRYRSRATEFTHNPFRAVFDEQFQRALLDCAFYIATPNAESLPAILGHARDGDARVREVAVRALGDDIDRAASTAGLEQQLLWSAVVGALFDPAPSVVELSLGLIARAESVPEELSRVVIQQLTRLFSEGERRVRASVVNAAFGWATRQSVNNAVLDDLLEAAEADRSWLVRQALRTTAHAGPTS